MPKSLIHGKILMNVALDSIPSSRKQRENVLLKVLPVTVGTVAKFSQAEPDV